MTSMRPPRAVPSQAYAQRLPHAIDEDGIHRLVHDFYRSVMDDALLGPIFKREIAPDRWPTHLDKMCGFWSSVLLRTDRYEGKPLPPHLALPELSDELFERWLHLFQLAAERSLDQRDADAVIALARRIAHSFRLAIAFHRGDDTLGVLDVERPSRGPAQRS